MPNNRKKAFEVHTYNNTYVFPYAVVRPIPRKGRWVVNVYVDPELDNEGFVYVLASGDEGILIMCLNTIATLAIWQICCSMS